MYDYTVEYRTDEGGTQRGKVKAANRILAIFAAIAQFNIFHSQIIFIL